ncbi:hypothetical protein AC1031_018976 [Aphanomyces cochlioides]|nr:hypothetical protein AC1031_018976 [Aphanomyces cochlioides]
MRSTWKTLMEKKDVRMKVVNEVFGSIEVIKFNTWEERYYAKIQALRDDELKSVWKAAIIQALMTVMNYTTPVALTTVSFASYVLILGQSLTAAKVFTALSLFRMIKSPMMRLPQIIAAWMQALVSYKRFTEFLALEERDLNAVTVIEVKNGKPVETARESKKDECPVMISPLKARQMYFEESELDADTKPSLMPYESFLSSPSLKSPFGNAEGYLFTPVDEFEDEIFREGDASGKLVVALEREAGRVSNEVFLAYFNAFGGWPMVIVVLVFCALSIWQSLQIASDLWLSAWTSTSSMVSAKEFHSTAAWYILVYAILAIGSSTIVSVRSLTISWAGLRASKQHFDGMSKALLGAPMRFFDANPLGRILNRSSGDINQIDGRIPGSSAYFLAASFITLFTLGTTICIIGWMGFVIIPLMWIYYKVGFLYVQPGRELERLGKTSASPLITHTSETVVRAFGHNQVRRFERIHQEKLDRKNETDFCDDLARQWFSFRVEMISAGMVLTTTVSLDYMHEYLTAGLIGLVFNYALQFTSELGDLIWVWSGLETEMVAAERVAEYTNVEQEATRIIPGSVSSSWPQDGSIQFHNVSFRYKPTDPLVLKNITFQVRSGEKVGIVGRTGAGKSSLTMALFRINEIVSGTMKISGTNISNIGIKTLRESMAIIPQNPILFKGTLRHYLDPFDQYTDAELWDVRNKVVVLSSWTKPLLPSTTRRIKTCSE